MQRSFRTALTAAIFTIIGFGTAASAADWPNWRGPNHDGLSSETGLETRWEGQPPAAWERAIGSGFSGFACVDGKAYTCGTQDDKQVLFCLNADTGDVIWQHPVEPEYSEGMGGDGPRGTPAVNEGRVYVQGARGRLICCDAAKGKELWQRQFNAVPQWGYSGSVLIEGDLAIAIAGNEDGPLIALNKKTGETVWKRGRAPVGYSTPYPFTLDGRRYVVGFLGDSAIIVEARTGREVWNMPWKTSYDVNAATPIFHDGLLFFSSGYKHGSIVLRLRHEGTDVKSETVWQSDAIRAKFQSPVLYDGHLYTSDEVGLKCVEFATGDVKWQKRRTKFGTVVVADGHLFVLTEGGELLVAPATPTGFEPTTRAAILDGRCWTVPTLYRGRIYARNLERAVCLRLTE